MLFRQTRHATAPVSTAGHRRLGPPAPRNRRPPLEQELQQLIVRLASENPLFGTISYLLEHYPLPPKLRAGLYRVLTRLDGVKLIGNVTDLAGRRAVSVAIDIVGRPLHERDELLLDPATGRLLGARSVLTRNVPGWRVPAGTVIDQRVFLEASVVDSRTTRPQSRPQGSLPQAAEPDHQRIGERTGGRPLRGDPV